MVLQLTHDGRLQVIAGHPLHCPAQKHGKTSLQATLTSPQSMAFSPSGDLYIAESDSQRINRVRVVTTNGQISLYAGKESKCSCLNRDCDCYNDDHFMARNAKFSTISAIAVTPDGTVYICDQGNYRIRAVRSSLPTANSLREYEIFSPSTQEVYVFNRFGQHIFTRNILTRETIYKFSYNVNTSNGKLSSITDASGKKISILRDYAGEVNSIENSGNQKFRVEMSRMQMLQAFISPNGYNMTFSYHGANGLLHTIMDSGGNGRIYEYNENGRLVSTIMSTGETVTLSSDINQDGSHVSVQHDHDAPDKLLISDSSVIVNTGKFISCRNPSSSHPSIHNP